MLPSRPIVTACLLALLSLSAPAPALAQEKAKPEAATKPLLDIWQVAYFEGLKVGHSHLLAREVTVGGSKLIRTTRSLSLTLKRYGSVVSMSTEQTSDETAAGKVRSMTLTQRLHNDTKTTITARVEGDRLVLTSTANPAPRTVEWDDEAIGPYAQETFFQRKKLKPGERFTLKSYEMPFQGLLTMRGAVKQTEQVDQLRLAGRDGKASRVTREPVRLLRIEATPDEVVIGGTPVQLPKKVAWLDGNLMQAREQLELPGVGVVILYNTTREAALKEGVAPHLLPDLGLNISIPVRKTLDEPYRVNEAVYRVRLKEDLPRVFFNNARQDIRDRKGNTFELAVKAIRAPGKKEKVVPPGKEYLESNHFITSADPRVRKLAADAVGTETDPWKKAQRLEKWVHDSMRVSTSVGFPTAAVIAKDLEGDCRQHALLLAALCRAAGVPARTALGVVYAREHGKGPAFVFHMWTEVYVQGQWMSLDAVIGEGSVGATHLKMGHHSWANTETLAPFLPIQRVLGKVQIDVESAE